MKLLSNWLQQHDRHGPLVNSYDLLKALAVIIMIIDHFGYYFDPQNMWWRAIGRTGFPVWFFLAGYSKKGEFSKILIPGMLAIMAVRYGVGVPVHKLLPVNALLPILLIRLMIIWTPADFYRRDIIWVFTIPLLALVLAPHSSILFEYGTIGLLFGYLGFVVKNDPANKHRHTFAALCLIVFIVRQLMVFPMDEMQANLMTLGTIAFLYWVYNFKLVQFPRLEVYPGAGPLIRALGRHTLLIYVSHIILFIILHRVYFAVLWP